MKVLDPQPSGRPGKSFSPVDVQEKFWSQLALDKAL